MQALEVGHLGGIAGFHKRFVAGLDQCRQPAAQHDLLAEQIRFSLFAEIRFDDSCAPSADGRSIRQADLFGIPGRILMNGQEAGHAAAFRILRSYQMTRAFRGDHEDVNVRWRHDLPEVDVEAVAEGQIAVLLQIRGHVSPIDGSLDFVRSKDHHDVRALCRIGARHHLEAGPLGLLP